MTNLKLCIATLAIFTVSICQAQDAERGRGARGPVDPAQVISRLDTNEDGVISEDEFLTARLDRAERGFNRRDRDDDGFISSDETGRRRHANQDVDREAFLQCLRDELGDDFEASLSGEERFAATDTNDDGLLSLDEVLAALETRASEKFDRIDTDDDGFISLEELEAAFAEKQNRHEIIRACKEEAADPFEE